MRGQVRDGDVGRPALFRDLERVDDEDEPLTRARVVLAPVELGTLRLGGAVGLQRLELWAAAARKQEHGGEKQWPAHRSNLRS